MGADLYMEKSYEERVKKHKRNLDLLIEKDKKEEAMKVIKYLHNDDVYFRDSYNAGNTLWAMGLSWWTDILPIINEEGIMEVEGIKKFLNMVEEEPLIVSDDFLKEMPDKWTSEDGMKYLKQGKCRLVCFLKKSLLKDERIVCSL